MPRNPRIDKRIEFIGDAANAPNVRGDILPERMASVDWFDTYLDVTNVYTQTLGGTSDAGALVAGGSNGLLLTTGTGDNEISFIGTAPIFDVTTNPTIEARVTIADVSGTSFFFGFSDANTESTPASTIDYADGTLAAEATDAAGFVVDADKLTSTIYAATIATAGSVAGVSSGIIWTDGQTKNLRVKLNSDLSADFWVDGVAVAHVADAVTDVPFCAVFNYGTRANDGANTVTVKYLAKFQDQ